MSLSTWAQPILEHLARASWHAALLAALLFMLFWLTRDRIPARWRYRLWLLVVLRLLLPVVPSSRFSVHNLWAKPMTAADVAVAAAPVRAHVRPEPVAEATVSLTEDELAAISAPARPVASRPQSRAIPSPAAITPAPRGFRAASIWSLTLLVYASGVLALLLLFIHSSLRASRLLKRLAPLPSGPHVDLLRSCAAEMCLGEHRLPMLMVGESDAIPAPALMGFFRPRLLLPRGVLDAFDSARLRLVFLHELGHVQRRDVLVNYLISMLQVVHWFNPVLHLAFARLRAERELACDELVLSVAARANGDARAAYGRTMLDLLDLLAGGSPLPKLALTGRLAALAPAVSVSILESSHPIKRRITMIASFDARTAKRGTILAVTAALALAAVTFTDSARGQRAADAPTVQRGETRSKPPSSAGDPAAAPAAESKPAAPTGEGDTAPANNSGPGKNRPAAGANPASDPNNPADPRSVTKRLAARRLQELANNKPADVAAEASTARIEEALRRPLAQANFQDTAFADVIEYLRDVTGVNIYVDWRELEASGIPPSQLVNVNVKNVPAAQVLKLALRGISKDLQYQIDDGVVVIFSVNANPNPRAAELVTRAYDVSDLLAGPGAGPQAAATTPAVSIDPASDPLIQNMEKQIIDLQLQVTELTATRGDQHADVRRAKDKLTLLKDSVAARKEELATTNTSTGKVGGPITLPDDRRQQKLSELATIIRDTVAPEGWRENGGNEGTIKWFNNKLIVSAPEPRHHEVEKVLDMLRDKADPPTQPKKRGQN